MWRIPDFIIIGVIPYVVRPMVKVEEIVCPRITSVCRIDDEFIPKNAIVARSTEQVDSISDVMIARVIGYSIEVPIIDMDAFKAIVVDRIEVHIVVDSQINNNSMNVIVTGVICYRVVM